MVEPKKAMDHHAKDIAISRGISARPDVDFADILRLAKALTGASDAHFTFSTPPGSLAPPPDHHDDSYGNSAGIPIVLPDGSAVGTLTVIVPDRRPDSTDHRHLADLAAIAAERIERRRLAAAVIRLDRVRFLRERLLAVASDAPDFAAAITATANIFIETTGAASCYVFRLAPDGNTILPIDGAGPDGIAKDEYLAQLRATTMRIDNTAAGEAFTTRRQVLRTNIATGPHSGHPATRMARAYNLATLLITPFDAGTERYAFSIGFAGTPDDIDDIAALMQEATAALRPLLRRLLDEEAILLYRRALDASPDPAIICEAEPVTSSGLVISYVNAAFTEHTGYTAEEVVGQTPHILQGPDTAPEARAAIRRALVAWSPVRQEILNYRKDGSQFWVELNIAPVANASGWYTHWVSVQRDTTERHEDEQRRIEAARELEFLIDAMPGVLTRVRPRPDGSWANVFCSNSIELLTGYPVSDFFANLHRSRISEPDLVKVREALTDALNHGTAKGEINFRHRDGEIRVLQASMRANPRADGAPEIIIIWTDVTAERELAVQAALTGRLATLGEMASGIAHELNQPLTTIALLSETLIGMLGTVPGAPPKLTTLLERISSQTLRAGKIIDNLRDFTRGHASGDTAISLADAARRTDGLVGAMIRGDGVTLEIAVPEDLPLVRGEVTRVEQVLVNLLTNARDALLARPRTRRAIRMTAAVDADVVRLEVSDTAGGIPADVLDRVFDPFFTTKGPDRGTGLGLSISRTAMRRMGGRIAVRNGPEGAIFTLLFTPAET